MPWCLFVLLGCFFFLSLFLFLLLFFFWARDYQKDDFFQKVRFYIWTAVEHELGNLCIPAHSFRSSHRRCSVRKGVLRNFAKIHRKTAVPSLFFGKVATLRPATLLKKRHVFFCEFFEISKNAFFTEHLWATASEVFQMQSSWYSSRLKAMIKHVRKYKKPGFYQFTGLQKSS